MATAAKFTKGEELANALSHLTGTLLAVAGLVLLLNRSIHEGDGWHIISSAIFGASMIILYLSSTMTHSLPMGKWKDFFFNMDRVAIYILIAGTYTPITLVTLRGPVGWVLFGIEWGLALVGTFMIVYRPGKFNKGVNGFYVLSYAVMGWLILAAIVPVCNSLSMMGCLWILIGGICYTLGIYFFKRTHFRYHHLVWHLLVMAGTLSHFFAVFFYIIPG